MKRYDNIFLVDTEETYRFTAVNTGRRNLKLPERISVKAHADKLLKEYQEAEKEFQSYSPKNIAAIKHKTGTYVEFSGAENCDLVVKSLENISQGIKLLNVRDELSQINDTDIITTKATVYIPNGKEEYFIKKITEYATELTIKGKPKNNDLISSIETISSAINICAYWIGNPSDMPTDKMQWFELWIHYDKDEFDSTLNNALLLLDDLGVSHSSKDAYIKFPERLVISVYANRDTLLDIIKQGVIVAEIRKPAEPNAFFLDCELTEQSEWAKDLLDRTQMADSGVVVCVLDSGININHPLIQPYVAQKSLTFDSSWGVNDNFGHGTNMAGVILYNDLKRYLISQNPVILRHKIESVKIWEKNSPTPVNLYGHVTESSILLPEITLPNVNRIYCMAVTDSTSALNNGQPSSWSGAVDKLIYEKKKLVIISAGNTDTTKLHAIGYPDLCLKSSVQDPAQAWNALTVGAYTIDTQIDQSPVYKGYFAVAKENELSPYSSTSDSWGSKWPIKPEVVCDGGNVAYNGTTVMEPLEELSKLTLNKDFSRHYFDIINATSAASAQCSNIAAQILSTYPNISPEVLRALIVHSARWTDAMKKQFCYGKDTKSIGRKLLLHACGYGVPDLHRAIDSFDNSVNMIIEGEIQPYEKQKGTNLRTKEMHLHTLPWPSEILKSLENAEVKLRITLSYFIEPGPGEKGWNNKYRYASCGLRFDIKRAGESLSEFHKRINNAMRDENYDKTDNLSNNWYLGANNRNVGSIHSDVWTDTAINLSESNYVAVYPVIGWWRERSNLKKYNSKLKYALIISLETPSQDVDLYTPITTKIANRVTVSI